MMKSKLYLWKMKMMGRFQASVVLGVEWGEEDIRSARYIMLVSE